ncbi:MAG: hypothetical protein E7434_08010 [Ruminococcaceae bacterium]|nr:hypothetical protein [Oscillospiraceae bacterium]
MALTILIAGLAVCGIFLVAWSLTEAFVIKIPLDSVHIFYLHGSDADVEQQMRSCLWMKNRHGLRGRLLFVDCGISPQAQITAQLMLKADDNIHICAKEQVAQYIKGECETLGAGTH